MKKLILTTFIVLACFSMQAQQSALTVKPAKIQAGKEVQFTYTGKLAKEGTAIYVVLFDMKENNEQLLETKLENKKITFKLHVPDSVVYLNFSIANGDELDDNNKLGYDFNVYKKGKPAKGTFLKQGEFIRRGIVTIKGYPFGVKQDFEKVAALMEKEYALHPEMKAETQASYVGTLSRIESRADEARVLAQKAFDETMLSGTDDSGMSTYAKIIYPEDYKKRDSLELAVMKRFPKGQLNFRRKLFEFYYTNDPDKVFRLNDTLQQQYPQECKQAAYEINNTLIIAYRKKKDYANFDKLISNVKDNKFLGEQYNQIAWEMVLADKDLTVAKTYWEKSKVAMDLVQAEKKPSYYTQNEWDKWLSDKRGNYLDTYAFILYKLGDKKEALKQQRIATEMTKGNNSEINERLIQFLVEDNQMKEALARAEKFIVADKSTVKIDSLYRVAYMAVNGSDNGLKEAQNKLAAQMKDAPDFTLKTLDGRTVKLSDLKGKVVVLDFWATWCGPCKASFPGMQKAVDAFKDDKEVCFFFINTSERTSDEKRRESIQKTMEDKKVNFEVLLDEKDGDDFLANRLYNVQGIPVKFIIDKNGKIRSTKVGFNGNDEELVKELKDLIESLK